jgi:uncharacterized protein
MTIVNDRDRHRFVIDENGAEAELVYELDGTSLRLIHTEVPPQFQGHGTGGELVQAAVDWARTDGLVIVPRCPFARRWLREHPAAVDGVEVNWSAGS